MDTSPVVRGHDYARDAGTATQAGDTAAAVAAHTSAAGEFAAAASSAASTETRRALRLLEQHHRRLAQLLQVVAREAKTEQAKTEQAKAKAEQAKASASASASASTVDEPTEHKTVPARAPSIAHSLASARGIRGPMASSSAAATLARQRGQPATPSTKGGRVVAIKPVHTQTPKVKPTPTPTLTQTKPSWVPPQPARTDMSTDDDDDDDDAAELAARDDRDDRDAKDASEDSFARFYSRFGNIIHRLSAPLAFAGLPLHEPEPEPTTTTTTLSKPKGQTVQAHGGAPDYAHMYSGAALRAVGRDALTNASDSFYVVPKTGHTASYANIVSFDHKARRREDYLDVQAPGPGPREARDARETPGRDRDPRDRTPHAVEELATENQSLKEMLDRLSLRLHAFEASAQSSHLALQESMRFMRPASPSASALAQTAGETDELARLRDELAASERARAHQEKTLQKYRDKWEKLKAGAKARRAQE